MGASLLIQHFSTVARKWNNDLFFCHVFKNRAVRFFTTRCRKSAGVDFFLDQTCLVYLVVVFFPSI